MFMFDYKIKDFFSPGNLEIDKKTDKDMLETALAICLRNNPEDFFPTLQNEIHNVIGDENCIADYYEMRQNGFST